MDNNGSPIQTVNSFEPRVFTQSRIKNFGFLLVAIFFAVIGVFMISAGGEALIFGILTIAFFGVFCIPVFAYQIFKPTTLTIDDKGFTESTVFGKGKTVSWNDVTRFGVVSGPKMHGVGIEYSPDYKDYVAMRAVAKGMTGIGGMIRKYSGVRVDELANILEAYRQHYSTGEKSNEV